MTGDILDYSELVARYETGLIENLRNFGFQTEYLDLWVPDEDLTRSLVNLFDAAAEAGRKSLAVRIPTSALTLLKQAGLPKLAAQRGQLTIEETGETAILRMDDLSLAAPVASASSQTVRSAAENAPRLATLAREDEPARQPERLSAPYRQTLSSAATNNSAPAPSSGLASAHATIDGLELEALIDPQTHVIIAMKASGARNAVAESLIAVLAGICEGLPVLEAADHGSIRLEFLLRGDSERPRAGIVIPETVDPAFRFTTALLRALLSNYRQITGFRGRENAFNTVPGPLWMQADEDRRRALLAQTFAAGGFSVEDVNVVAIEYDVRVVVGLDGLLAKNPAKAIVALERCIKKNLDDRLELFLAEVKDSNKLRRLSEPKSVKS